MKRCTVTHHVPSFGEIPEGSLWDDDSPYATSDLFEPVDPPAVELEDEEPPIERTRTPRRPKPKNEEVE